MMQSTVALIALSVISSAACCDLERFFTGKQVSVEESTEASQIIFRGFTSAAAPTSSNDLRGVYTAYFELINTYKGAGELEVWSANNYRYVQTELNSSPEMFITFDFVLVVFA